MIISLIAAMDRNRLIGVDNRLPWRLPADLRHFKWVTTGKPILMGRKTWDSLGRPLPGRKNIVLTRDTGFSASGCVVAHSVDEALAACVSDDEIMVIGGATLYGEMLDRAERMYLTLVEGEFEGDTYFPEYDERLWREVQREEHESDPKNPYRYSFTVLER